jgi:hypothetical protein
MPKMSQAKRQRLKRAREKQAVVDAEIRDAVGAMGANLDPTNQRDARLIQRAVRNEWIQPDCASP